MGYTINVKGKFKYIEEGEGDVIILLHGLFGSTGNFTDLIDAFKSRYKMILPILPIFDLPRRELTMVSIMEHVHDFIVLEGYKSVHIVGNSLGGHIGLLLTLKNPKLVKTLTLTGSSGLFENTLGGSFPRRQNYEFVKNICQKIFYDPVVATKELVDEVFDTVNTPEKGLNIIITAKSAMRHNLEHELHKIDKPTLLIWGENDTITPAFVGEDFKKKIKGAQLHVFDKCGHAPMMEKPAKFIAVLQDFLAASIN
jgi:2-hydroxy-6-oxonona-2,4-dienedioate hydrolase